MWGKSQSCMASNSHLPPTASSSASAFDGAAVLAVLANLSDAVHYSTRRTPGLLLGNTAEVCHTLRFPLSVSHRTTTYFASPAPPLDVRAELIDHFKACMTEIYIHI